MGEPTKLYYQLQHGKRDQLIALKLTAEELDLLDRLAGNENGLGRSNTIRFALYRLFHSHGFTMWEDSDE